jgi:hypothetical protein
MCSCRVDVVEVAGVVVDVVGAGAVEEAELDVDEVDEMQKCNGN